MAQDLARIRSFLTHLVWRERGLLLARISGQAGAVVALCAWFAVLAAAASWYRPLSTAVLVLACGLGAWAVVAVPLVRSWRGTGDRVRQARLVEEAHPELRGRLVTSAYGRRTAGESEAMAARTVRAAARVIGDASAREVHPRRGVLRWVLAAFGAVAALVGTMAGSNALAQVKSYWLAPEVVDGEVSVVDTERRRSQRVGDLVIEYRYPAYTGLDPKRVDNYTGTVEGPPGTRVSVRARTAEAVESAALSAYEHDLTEVRVEDGGRSLHGGFTIAAEPGTYHFVLYARGASISTDSLPIVPEPDLAPDVRLMTDQSLVELPLDGAVSIPYSVSDDYGVARIDLDVQRRAPVRLQAFTERRAKVDDTLVVSPRELGLDVGDEVELRVVAWDNDTVSGSKSGSSSSLVLRVLGEAGMEARAADRQRVVRAAMLTVLADFLEEGWPVADASAGVARWGHVLHGRYATLADLLAPIREREGLPEAEVLRAVHESGTELIRFTQVAFDPRERGPAAEVDLDATALLRETAIEELEGGILRLDALLRAAAIEAIAEALEAADRRAEAMLAAPAADAQELLDRIDRLKRLVGPVAERLDDLDRTSMRSMLDRRVRAVEATREAAAEAARLVMSTRPPCSPTGRPSRCARCGRSSRR